MAKIDLKKKSERINPGATLSIELADKVREDILIEALPPGMKLTEQVICDQYGVSRTPVREALRTLETEGLVEIIPNRGAFVIGFSMDDMADLFELRKIYEAQAVRWAIMRISEEKMEELEESFEFMEFYTARGDARRMKELNARFHRCIYEAAHSRMLADILMSYQSYLLQSSRSPQFQKGHLDEIFREHSRVFDAFVKKDPEAGAAAMEAHIGNAAKRAH